MKYFGEIYNKSIMVSKKPLPHKSMIRFTVEADNMTEAMDKIKSQLPDKTYNDFKVV